MASQPKRTAAAAAVRAVDAAAVPAKRRKPAQPTSQPPPAASTSPPVSSSADSSDADEATESDSDRSFDECPSPTTAADAAGAAAAHNVSDTTPFDRNECLPSRLPIFRRHHIIVRQPAVPLSAVALANLTFTQYLDYFLSLDKNAARVARLFSDERYCLLLDLVMGSKTVQQLATERKLSKKHKKWLYNCMSRETFKYVVMEFTGRDVSELDKGGVLVVFKEPDPHSAQGNSFVRRDPQLHQRADSRHYAPLRAGEPDRGGTELLSPRWAGRQPLGHGHYMDTVCAGVRRHHSRHDERVRASV